MKEFEGTVRIDVSAEVNPSENVEIVTNALTTVADLQYSRIRNMITGSGDEYIFLKNIYHHIRSKKSLGVVRKRLMKNIDDGSTHAYLNRQAATVDSIVFCESPDESPLGPIVLRIRSNRIIDLINWIAPRE